MMRLMLCTGDVPETGGHIAPDARGSLSVGEHPIAFIGGAAYCAVCKSAGVIAKAGGPYRMTNNDHEIALDGDVLLCQCASPPRLVARAQSGASVDDRVEESGAVGVGLSASAKTRAMPGGLYADQSSAEGPVGLYDEQVRLVGPETLEGYPYYIVVSDGRKLAGRLGADGKLPRISTGNKAAEFVVYWGDEALAKEMGDE
jgi:hypothetical protein